jgi:hypothetical protein
MGLEAALNQMELHMVRVCDPRGRGASRDTGDVPSGAQPHHQPQRPEVVEVVEGSTLPHQTEVAACDADIEPPEVFGN